MVTIFNIWGLIIPIAAVAICVGGFFAVRAILRKKKKEEEDDLW